MCFLMKKHNSRGVHIMILYFYTTSGCHLCEQAAVLLNGLDNIQIKVCDISDSESLVEQYGIRIPVLLRDDTKEELGWPFDKERLEQFIA